MNAVIFGGGKIARGFVAHLLYRSGYHITIVELNEELVGSLNRNGKYYVNVMGNPDACQWVTNYECISLKDTEAIGRALSEADIAFTSVGGKNLDSLAHTIAEAYCLAAPKMGDRKFTIITCENWKNPAKQLKESLCSELDGTKWRESFEQHVGVSEAVIMRSGVEATEEIRRIDVNAVSVTNFWELPVDRTRMVGELPDFEGVVYQDDFDSFLQRKLYTFNTTNATIAYLGQLRGIQLLSDAANDPEILKIVHQVHDEINPAIAKEMGGTLEEQCRFAQKALLKYQDTSVTDFTERHARDPLRKIGPFDRIVGTMRLVEKHGFPVRALAETLAAALYYPVPNDQDQSAVRLREMREQQGIAYILENVCEIGPDEPLASAVWQQIDHLKEKGWIDG